MEAQLEDVKKITKAIFQNRYLNCEQNRYGLTLFTVWVNHMMFASDFRLLDKNKFSILSVINNPDDILAVGLEAVK